ncbi:MAG: helix-turn-helix transcriptional regulator [Gammaproteobacteria bacterium]|jgi:DNA-binding CsgD family transcriptional regulator
MVAKVDVKHKEIFDQMPGCWGCKDKDSVFMYANEEYGRIIGVKHHLDCIGRTDFDMPCATVECAPLFREQDKSVILTEKKLRILDIHPFADNKWKAYVFTKTPLYTNEEIAGTIFHGVDITSVATIEIGALLGKISINDKKSSLIGQSSYIIDNNRGTINLSTRESEIIFFTVRGKTAKEIAKILNISYRTVEDYLYKLKLKFNVKNKAALIDSAIGYGYLNYIPTSLFNKQLSLILKEN